MNTWRHASHTYARLVTAVAIGTGLALMATPRPAIAAGHDMSRCVSVDHTSNELADFIINSCDSGIFVKWTDQGSCSNWRCGNPVAAHSKTSVTKMKGASYFAACLYGEDPKIVTNTQHECVG
jgi:hypothetical protein